MAKLVGRTSTYFSVANVSGQSREDGFEMPWAKGTSLKRTIVLHQTLAHWPPMCT